MYEDFYEDDKEASSESFNKALLEMMILVQTKSNVKFSSLTFLFKFFTSILTSGDKLSSEDNLSFLKNFEIFMADFDRFINIVIEKKDMDEKVIDLYLKEILKDFSIFTEFLINLK